MEFGNILLTFWMNLLSPSSGLKTKPSMQQQTACYLKIVLFIGDTARTPSLSQITLFMQPYAFCAKLMYKIKGYKYGMWSQYTILLLEHDSIILSLIPSLISYVWAPCKYQCSPKLNMANIFGVNYQFLFVWQLFVSIGDKKTWADR